MSIHARIKEGRMRLKLTEQQFADRVGVTRAAVQQWEREGGTAPRRATQEKVAQVLGISVAELMTGTSSADVVVAKALPATANPSEMIGALRAIEQIAQRLQQEMAAQSWQAGSAHHTESAWPFKKIKREQWEAMSDQQKHIVESVASGFLI